MLNRREVLATAGAATVIAAGSARTVSEKKPQHVFPLISDAEWGWKNRFAEDNCYTIVDRYMTAIIDGRWYNWKVDSDVYRNWVAANVGPGEIPPHINFAGAVVSVPGGDPTFYKRWKLRTLQHLASGRLK